VGEDFMVPSAVASSDVASVALRSSKPRASRGEGFALPDLDPPKFDASRFAAAKIASPRLDAPKADAPAYEPPKEAAKPVTSDRETNAKVRTPPGQDVRAAAPGRGQDHGRKIGHERKAAKASDENAEPANAVSDVSAEESGNGAETATVPSLDPTVVGADAATEEIEALATDALPETQIPIVTTPSPDHVAAVHAAVANGSPPPADPAVVATLGAAKDGAPPSGLADGVGKAVEAHQEHHNRAEGETAHDAAGTATDKPAATGPQPHAAAESKPLADFKALLDREPGASDIMVGPLKPTQAAAGAAETLLAQAADMRQQASRPTPMHAVPVEIGLRAMEGMKRFDIRLDPPELGRVEVRLEFTDDGQVTARLTVDRVETAGLLQRDARTLERAFDQAGFKTSDGGIDIRLSDRGAQQHGRQAEEQAATGRGRAAGAEAEQTAIHEFQTIRRQVRLGGVDLSV